MLNRDTKLYRYHFNDFSDYKAVVGEIQNHPQDKTKWGLTNISPDTWTYTKPNGETAAIEPGRTVPLVNGAKINFGSAEGEIKI